VDIICVDILGGISKQTVGVLCRLELVPVGGLLAFDAVSGPGHCGQPLRGDFFLAMQTGSIRFPGDPGSLLNVVLHD
jgi:hypothetical protein